MASRRQLHFAFFGGGIAWTLHLLLSYLISEFACLAQVDDAQFLGVMLIAWSLLAVSVIMLGTASAAALVGWRAKRALQRQQEPDSATAPEAGEDLDVELHYARSGAIMSGIFALVILCQMVPIFYFLSSC
jgi:hypothetical protein